jgi:hypothetical protein
LSKEWAEKFDSPEWKWFQYRGIALPQIFFLSIRNYIALLLYYAAIVENLLVRHPAVRRLIVFPSSHSLSSVPSAGTSPIRRQPLLREQLDVVVACAALLGKQAGVAVVVPREPVREKQIRFGRFVFALKRAVLELGIHAYNLAVTLVRPRGTPRILASDYWSNIAPVMSQLPQGELILFDRSEAVAAGFANLWRSRVRLYNFSSFSIRGRAGARAEAQKLFEERWRGIRESGFPEYAFKKLSLRPLVAEAFGELLRTVVPQTLRDIDGAYALLRGAAPDIVFLRASMSVQTHFCILAAVARAAGIPSLELQHGLENLGPDSYYRTRRNVEYFAVYGQVVQDELASLGFPRARFPIVGSPRFDAYAKEAALARRNHPEKKGISVLCIAPSACLECFYDDYDLEAYYAAIAKALEKVPGSSAVIKLRPGPAREGYYRELIGTLFARVPHTIAQYETLPELFAAADAVVSYYSTAVLEALQFHKPTIIFSSQQMEKEVIRFHFTQYADAGGCIIADTTGELDEALRSLAGDAALRGRLALGAAEALSRFCLFDGRASERIVELIERLARKGVDAHE